MAVPKTTLVLMLVLLGATVQSDVCPTTECNCTDLRVSLNSPQIVTFDIGDNVTLSCNRTRGDYRDDFEIYGPGYTIPQLVRPAVIPLLNPTITKTIDETGCGTVFSVTLHNLQSSENHVNILCESDQRVSASRAFLLIQNQMCPIPTTDTPTTADPTSDTPTDPTTDPSTTTTDPTTVTPTTTDPTTVTSTTTPPTTATPTGPATATPTTDSHTDAETTDQQTTNDPSVSANIECQPGGVAMYYILGVVSGIVLMALLGLFLWFCRRNKGSDTHKYEGENGLTATNRMALESNGNGALTNGNTLTISLKPLE